jgi:hypothetical protein
LRTTSPTLFNGMFLSLLHASQLNLKNISPSQSVSYRNTSIVHRSRLSLPIPKRSSQNTTKSDHFLFYYALCDLFLSAKNYLNTTFKTPFHYFNLYRLTSSSNESLIDSLDIDGSVSFIIVDLSEDRGCKFRLLKSN